MNWSSDTVAAAAANNPCDIFHLKIKPWSNTGGSPIDGAYVDDVGGPIGFYLPVRQQTQTETYPPTVYSLSGSMLLTYPDRQAVRIKLTSGGYPDVNDLTLGPGDPISCIVDGIDIFCSYKGGSVVQVCQKVLPTGEKVDFIYVGSQSNPSCQDHVRFQMECTDSPALTPVNGGS